MIEGKEMMRKTTHEGVGISYQSQLLGVGRTAVHRVNLKDLALVQRVSCFGGLPSCPLFYFQQHRRLFCHFLRIDSFL